MKVFKNILTFLGLAATTTKIELTEEQIEKIDTSLGELATITTDRDALKVKVTELETTTAADKTKITQLEGQVNTLTTEKTAAETKVTTLTAEVERLGKLDGGKFTASGNQEEKKGDETTELSQSQKDLNDKVKNL